MRYLFLFLLFSSVGLLAQNYLPNQHPDFYYNQAISSFQSGDYKVARHLLDEYLVTTETPEALYYRAMSSIKTGEKSGEFYVQSFIKNYPLHPLAHKAQFELAHQYFARKNYQKALLAYGVMNPETLDKSQKEQAYFEKGYSLLQIDVVDQGLTSLESAYAVGGEYQSRAAYYLGVYSEGDTAEQWLLKASEDTEWQLKSAIYLSQIYLRAGEYKKLQGVTEPLLSDEKSLENTDLHFYTAESYYQEQSYRSAARYFDKGIELGARKPDAETLFKLGHAYYEIGEKEKAIDQLKKSGLNESATGQASAFQLGKIYTELGQFTSALHAYEIAGSSDHDLRITEESQFLAGKTSVQLAQYDQAIVKLESFLREFPASDKTDEANDLLSNAYLSTSNYDLIINHFEKISSPSLVLKKNYQQVTLVKGMQSFSDRQIAEALGYLTKSVNTNINRQFETQAYYWIGESQFILGDKSKAEVAYRKAKSLDTSYPMPDYGLGYLAYNSNDYAIAKELFQSFKRKAISSHQFQPDASLRVADCEYALKNYDASLAGYQALFNANVSQDYLHYQIGLIHQLNSRVDQAVNSFMKVVQMSASTYRDNAMFQVAQTYFEDAQFTEAEKGFTAYIDQYANESLAPYARIKRGLCYFNMEQNQRSKEDYLFVLDNHINHPSAQSALLGIQELQKRGEEIDFDQYLAAFKTANPEDSSLESIEFEQAKNVYFAQKYQEAITRFERILAKNPEGAFKEDVIYYLGDANDRIENVTKATRYYDLIADMPTSKYLNRVLDKRGRLLLRTEQSEKAISNYHMLQEYSKNRKESYLASEGLMKAHFLLGSYDKSIEYGRSIVRAEWKPSNAESEASLYIGKSLVNQGMADLAIDEFLNVINSGSDEIAAEAKYSIGRVQYDQQKYKQSLETLFQLNTSYAAYSNWVGKSFLLIADNYLAMEELLQAKATLNSLIDNHPDAGIKSEARVKLDQIEKLQLEEVAQDTAK